MNEKNDKKSKLIYKLIVTITLFVPLPLYLFLMAALFNIKPDYIIYTNIDNIEVIEYKEDNNKEEVIYFITTKDNATIDGIIEYKDNRYGIVITSEDIIKIDKNYYSYILKDNVMQLVDIKKFEVQKQQSYKLPITFFISLFGVLMVALIVQKKMQWHKKYPRLAAFITLLSVTVILFILNTVISNILGVFIVATAEWAIYCLEYLVHQGTLEEKDKDKKESEIIRALKGMMN